MLKKIKISYFFIKRNQGSIMFSLDALVWIIHSKVKEFKRAKPKNPFDQLAPYSL